MPAEDAAVAVVCRTVRAIGGALAALLLQWVLAPLPTASGIALTVAGTFLIGAVGARAAGFAAALVGGYAFSEVHLADRHGVLGTGSVARTTVLVLALAAAAAWAGHAWWLRSHTLVDAGEAEATRSR